MAEIQSSQTSKQKGVQKCKKLSTRVDLTPMVDLGFLLITFFIFTTTLHEPKITKLFIPNDVLNNHYKISSPKVLQVLLGGNDKVYYYFGDDVLNTALTSFSSNGLREVILKKQQQLAQKYGNKEALILMIKPTAECSYKNIIDALDEVQINSIKHYFFIESSIEDQKMLLRS